MNLDSIRETFLVESDEILVSIEKALLTLEENPTDQNEINSLFRAVHTLKGAAGMFGFQKTVDFAHHLETWLDALRSGDVKLDSQKISALLHAHDQISELVNIEARKGENVPPGLIQNGQEILASLTGDATQPERNSDSTELEEDEKIHGIWKIEISLKPDILKHGLDPLSFIRYLGRFGEIRNLTVDHSRLDLDSFDPQLCYLLFQIDFEGNISKSELLDVFDFMLSESEIKIEPPARIIKNSEPETSLLQSNTKATVTKSTGQENQKRFIRIEATKLDMLIDLVGELVIAGATIRQQADHHKLGDIQESAGAMSRLIEDLRDNVMSVRMVQIGETFRKFERIIRDASKELNKDIQMLIEGGDTEL
ncbi:MAG: Hpt domain-containing protein, partial [Leptospiraceae bacterium]|nr:Hpt domain-containing protein [Leptospiraceae bacterium]